MWHTSLDCIVFTLYATWWLLVNEFEFFQARTFWQMSSISGLFPNPLTISWTRQVPNSRWSGFHQVDPVHTCWFDSWFKADKYHDLVSRQPAVIMRVIKNGFLKKEIYEQWYLECTALIHAKHLRARGANHDTRVTAWVYANRNLF